MPLPPGWELEGDGVLPAVDEFEERPRPQAASERAMMAAQALMQIFLSILQPQNGMDSGSLDENYTCRVARLVTEKIT
ncbi:MAG: hypothetical protein DMG60_01305 [Acidobacteria bacterium]|nr:MAG: hypothetical protein DMG60_01305 [Acidobacteriota bacterium]